MFAAGFLKGDGGEAGKKKEKRHLTGFHNLIRIIFNLHEFRYLHRG